MAPPVVLGITIRMDGTAQVNRDLGNVSESMDRTARSSNGANRQFADMARETLGLGSALRGLAGGLSAVALYHESKALVQYADTMTLLDGRIKIATSSQKDYINSSKELVAISLRTGTSFEANATIFSRINKALEDMGGTTRNTTALTETLAQTMRISGTDVGEAASTIRQLSQALSSGLLRGDEFNSIMENAPRLAQALADGMHVNIGALRAMAEAGELSSKRVIQAIQSQGKVLDDEFKRIPLTVGAAMENISTAFGQYVLEANKGSGATAGLAQQLNTLADNLAPVIDGIVTLGKIAVTVFAGQMAISIGTYAAAKYAAITLEYAHAAALTMDIERTVALTAAQLAETSATVALIQATLASTTAMGARMAITNQLNIALLAQAEAQLAATAAMAAQTAANTAAGLSFAALLNPIKLVNIGLAGLVGWEIGKWLNSFETVRIVATASLGAILQGIENVTYYWDRLTAVVSGNSGKLDGLKAAHLAQKAAIDDNIVSTIAYGLSGKKAAEATGQQTAASAALTVQQTASSEATQKAATAEASRLESVTATIAGLQSELEINRLGDKEKILQTELHKNLAKAKGAEITQITAITAQIIAETEARSRQQAMWGESIKQANELYDLQHDASDTQRLAGMAKSLHLMGATNEEISKRVNLERQLSDAVKAHPDQDPQVVRDSIIAKQRAADEIAKYTDSKTDESAKWMEAAFKKASENIQDSFADMFENMLNGDATASFDKFADNIRKTLNQAISQQLALDLQGLFSANGSIVNVFKSGLMFALASIPSFFKKSGGTREIAPSEIGNSTVLGTGAMHIADSFSRDHGVAFQTKTALDFNKNLEKLTGMIASNINNISTWIGNLGSKLASFSVVQTVANFFKPVTSLISQGASYISNIYTGLTSLVEGGVTAVTNFIGLTAAGTGAFAVSGVSYANGQLGGLSATGGSTGSASAGAGGISSAAGNIATVLAVIKFGYDMFTTWTDSNLDLANKMVKSAYALSDGMLAIGLTQFWNPVGWGLMIAAAITNVVGAVTDIFHNGANVQNIARLVGGVLGEMVVGLFVKARVPNVWMNTYNPDQSGAPLQNSSALGTYTHTGNKDAHIGEYTPFGVVVVSMHEMSMSAAEMKNAFGGLLTTVKTVDINLYNTIQRLDTKFGEAGKTMDYYNNMLRSNNGNEVGVKTQQDASGLNTGDMLLARYSWITDRLAESGSAVGVAVNAWFDVITSKFIDVSRDNSMFVLGVINSLSANVESFMAFPISLVDLIGRSVKSVGAGGTPDSVSNEIMGILNTFVMVKTGLEKLDLTVDSNRVVGFLANINAIGYGVQDAGMNLLAYGIALKKINGTVATSGDALMNTVESKFKALKAQGFDNTQMNAWFGSFGLMANLFAEAKVAFTSADLDAAANHIHDLAKASVDVAKNTIDHAIATEKLTNVSRESAIATLVKSGKIEEATVAEAEYGVSIQGVTKDLLAQMGFIQQIGFVAGKTLGEMSVSATSWQAAAKNVVSIFGDMQAAMKWLDDTAKTFLSPKFYAQYNLDTVNRSLSNMQASNPALAGLTESSISAALKSGDAMASFINQMAQGNGELAKETVSYIQLISQRITAEKALADEQQKLMQKAADDLANAQKTAADAANAGLDRAMQRLTASVAAEKALLAGKYKDDTDALKAQLDATLKANATSKQSSTELSNAITSIAGKIRAVLDSTVVDSAELSRQRRLSAQTVLQSALDLARSGGSLVNFTRLDQALTDIAKPSEQLFATFLDYQRDQGRTAVVISDLADHADTQVSVAQLTLTAIDSAATAAQKQYDDQYKILTDTYNAETARLDGILSSAQTQIDLLRGINNSVLSLADAVRGVESAKAIAAQTTVAVPPTFAVPKNEGPLSNGDYQSSGGASYSAATGLITSESGRYSYTIDQAKSFVNDALSVGNPAIAYTTAKSEGISAASLDALMGWDSGSSNKWAAANKLPAFASGGDHLGGLRIVGENGPELESTGPSRIFNAQQTRNILSSGKNDDALILEIRALKSTVEKLESKLAKIETHTGNTDRNTKESSTVLGKVTLGGTAVRTTAA